MQQALEFAACVNKLEQPHRDALHWFWERRGSVIPWPEPLHEGLHLVNKAKGIHKPKGWRHALSVRQTMGGPYSDREIVKREDGSWQFDYYQEGTDPALRDADFTNRALMQNIKDGVPVAVVRQVRPKPR